MKRTIYTDAGAQTEILRLRFEARLAHLDGRDLRAKQLNRDADKLAAQLRTTRQPTSADISGEPTTQPPGAAISVQ